MRLHQLHTIFHIYRNLTVFLYSIHLIFSALLSNLDFSIDLPHNVIPCNAMPCHAMLCYVTHPHTYVLTAAEALRQRKYDVHTHKSPHKNPSKTSTRTITTNSTTPTITSVNVTNRSTTTIVKQRDQQQPLQYNNKSKLIIALSTQEYYENNIDWLSSCNFHRRCRNNKRKRIFSFFSTKSQIMLNEHIGNF